MGKILCGTLWDQWQLNAGKNPGGICITHWVTGEPPYRWTWAALLDKAACYGCYLKRKGVSAGDVCALVMRHHPDFYPLYMGIESIGALPAVLAYPNARLHPDKFREGLAGMAAQSGLEWILTEKDLGAVVQPLVESVHSTIRGNFFPWEETGELSCGGKLRELPRHRAAPESACLLQHSSGTTGLQKAVILSHQAVLRHVECYAEAIRLAESDVIVNWLPLYHDMGLIAAFHLPLAYGIPSVQLDPFEWVSAPSIMFEAVSSEKGTVAWMPNFSFQLMADRLDDEDLESVHLDSLRQLINCSEPIRYRSMDSFACRFQAFGFRREALSGCYAMAETTFAVTQTEAGREPVWLEADRAELERGYFVPATAGKESRICVSSGRPIRDCQVRILDAAGKEVPDGRVGEIAIRSSSMFSGYRNRADLTADALRGGWYYSGDLGFRFQGEHFIMGRKKDLIIVAGKNIFPEDIEDMVGAVPGIIPGRVVAFGVDDEAIGTEQVWVVAETEEKDPAGLAALRQEIIRQAMKIDVTLSRVELVETRWLFKSSSGKPSRSANKARLLASLEIR